MKRLGIRKFSTGPLRSVLYMPASNSRALEKSLAIPADGFIFDLEDAVAPDMKAIAREQAIMNVNTKKSQYGRRQLAIRVNGTSTEWYKDDLVNVASSNCDAIVLPKAETSDQVQDIAQAIEKAGGNQSIWLMIETPKGVINCDSLASASKRVSALVMGSVDLANDLRCEPSRYPLMHALQTVVMCARANNISALDGVYIDTKDDAGFLAECEDGRRLGFDGKTLIHPKTVDGANKVFSPSPEAIEKARRIIQAHAEGVRQGKGAVTLDGKLIENLHVRGAERLLEFAKISNEN